MVTRRVLSVVLAAAMMISIGVGSRAIALEKEHSALVAELRQLNATTQGAAARADHLNALLQVAQHDEADRDAVLAVRPAFVSALAGLTSAIDSAQGKADTSAQYAAAVSAQQAVLAERADPAVIDAATATVTALTAKIDDDVAAWQAAQIASGPGLPLWSTGGQEGFARVRAALDRVGGGGVGLYESGSCAGGSAPACANSSGYIKYRADISSWSEGRLNWAMAHELAHIYQFQVWGSMTSSGSYSSLFGGDPEFLANCMAVVRGYPGSVGCDSEQQAWASGIWVGAVR